MPKGSPDNNVIPDWSMSRSPSPIPVIVDLDLDLPYAEEFPTLVDLSEDSPAINGLDPQPVDVDRWELIISPQEYQRRFKDTLATVQLISRAPLRRLQDFAMNDRVQPHILALRGQMASSVAYNNCHAAEDEASC